MPLVVASLVLVLVLAQAQAVRVPVWVAESARPVVSLDLLGRTGAEPGYPPVSPLGLVAVWADQAPLDVLWQMARTGPAAAEEVDPLLIAGRGQHRKTVLLRLAVQADVVWGAFMSSAAAAGAGALV